MPVKSVATTETDKGLPKLDISSKDLEGFHRYADGIVSQYRALVELKNLMHEQKASTKDIYRPRLVGRLDQYPIEEVDLTNLVNFPPKLQPIPVKPLFFDLAWNYIDYPGRATSGINGATTAQQSTAEEKKEPARKEPAKKGWFGFGR
jgi:signal recognition particle subunit SRP68